MSIEAFAGGLREVVNAKNAEERAEEEFLDVSQATSPLPKHPKKKTAIIWATIGLCTAAVGFFYMFG